MVKEMKTYRVIGETVTIEDIKECIRICKDENICIELEYEVKIPIFSNEQVRYRSDFISEIITEYTDIDELAKKFKIENKE